MYSKIQETASWLKERMTTNPKTAIVLGTGLGQLASEITDTYEFPYNEIPHFPVSTVEGHAGKLIFGKLGGVDILAMQGRFHYYEGYSMQEVTFPVRVMYELGIKTLFVSNAAGGMNPEMKIGDLMVITDAFTPPINMLFFAISGAGFAIEELPNIGLLGITYVITRVIGKAAGSYIGGKLTHQDEKICRYLGPTLMPQAGVALGLIIVAQQIVPNYGPQIRTVILCSTFIYSILGPSVAKWALTKAGEIRSAG